MKIIPDNLALARKTAGFTQTTLGDEVGVSYQQIMRYESGKSQPRPPTLVKIANTLGTTVEWLCDGDPKFSSYTSKKDGSLTINFPNEILRHLGSKASELNISVGEYLETVARESMIKDLQKQINKLVDDRGLKFIDPESLEEDK